MLGFWSLVEKEIEGQNEIVVLCIFGDADQEKYRQKLGMYI